MSSNFGFVINRQKSTFSTSILNRILKSKKNNFSSKVCNWGKINENIAIKKYKKFIGEKMWIYNNPKWPWLGTIPDGIVLINEKIMAIEIKSLNSKKKFNYS